MQNDAVRIACVSLSDPVTGSLPRLILDQFCETSLLAEDAAGLAGFLIGFPRAAPTAPMETGRGVPQHLLGRFGNTALSRG